MNQWVIETEDDEDEDKSIQQNIIVPVILTIDAPKILSQLGNRKREIVQTLRFSETSLTYDRIGRKMGCSSEQIRGISSACGDLLKEGILEVVGRKITITGTKASAFALKKPFDTAELPWLQNTLFAVEHYRPNIKETIIALLTSIGTKQSAPRDVSIEIVDMLIGIQIPDDYSFEIQDIKKNLPYAPGSLTSYNASKQAKVFASAARKRAYKGVVNGTRANGRGVTRFELGRETGMWLSTLLPRVKELIEYDYIEEGVPFLHPVTHHQQVPLRPKGNIALVDVGESEFYNERIKIAANLEALLNTPGIYLGDLDRIYNSVSSWTQDFIKKYSRKTE